MTEELVNIQSEIQSILNELGLEDDVSELQQTLEDYMTKDIYKVEIGSTAVTTTNLVTHTATVRDTDNTLVANRIVEFYKNNTLLGMAATNSSGVASITERITEGDIYYIHAIVRGTYSGEDKKMFVKNVNNVLDVDLWSASDYTKSVHTSYDDGSTITAQGGVVGNIASSTEYATKGERCIKSVLGANKYCEITVGTYDPTAKHTFKMDVYTPVTSLQVSLLVQDTTTTLPTQTFSVSVEPNTSFTPITLSINEQTGYNRLKIRVLHNADGPVYVDNIELLKQ